MNEKTPKNRTEGQPDVVEVGSEVSRESVSNGENSTRRGRIIARLAIFFERASMGGSRYPDQATEEATHKRKKLSNDELLELARRTIASEEALERGDYFVSGPEGATFNVSAEVAEEIKEKNDGELPDHIRIREDQVTN